MESCTILWFGMYQQKGENKLHTHHFFQMLAVTDGSGTVTIGNMTYAVKAGHLCLIGPDQPHAVVCSGKTLVIRDVKFMVNDGELAAALLHHTGCMIPADFSLFLSCFENIAQETLNARICYFQLINLRLFEMLVYIRRENEAAGPRAAVPVPRNSEIPKGESLAPVLSYIQENHQKPIGLVKLCEIAKINRTSLTQRFKAQLQVTPVRYINVIRLQHAKSLLTKTDTTVSEIAYSCGFQSVHYFCRTFKLLESCTPIQYRDSHSGCHYFSYQ